MDEEPTPAPQSSGPKKTGSDGKSGAEAEFSILLRSDLKRAGLGAALMRKIKGYCERRGIETLVGLVLKQNHGMRGLATHLGFATAVDPDDEDMITVRLALQPGQKASRPGA